MKLKIRTVYFKVSDMALAVDFWTNFLQIKPHKAFDTWHEFMCDNLRLALLLNEAEDRFTGSSSVPVFEIADMEVQETLNRAQMAGATVVLNALNDPKIKSCVLRTPDGHEFEISVIHD